MKIYERDKDLILEDVRNFDISDILECGQCFHFKKKADREYNICAKGRLLHVKQELLPDGKGRIIFYNTDISDYDKVWREYFDMDTDYESVINTILDMDKRLLNAVKAKSGIRILRQDFFETLISFIISQNKQIPQIKQVVALLSERYGTKVSFEGKDEYLFPTAEQLFEAKESGIRECKTGFRAPYVWDAVCNVYCGGIHEDDLRAMSVEGAREMLMEIYGVGEKVANCVLLFGLGRMEVFPVDVWMKRIMEHMYFGEETRKDVIEKFACEKFGAYAGYAQQYLFYYGRENGIGKN